MKTSTLLLTASFGLILANTAWAGPPEGKSQKIEPEKIVAKPDETDSQMMNKGDLVQEIADSPIATESSEVHELTQHVTGPRDAASGLPSGKRQHKPVSVTKEIDKASPVSGERDAASGLPTGKRQHEPMTVTSDIDKASPGIAARDAASGLPTGKREHKPFTVRGEIDKSTPVSADGVTDSSPEASDDGLEHQDSWIEARMADESKETLSFEDAVEVCRDENDLQACVDHKTGQSHVKELDKIVYKITKYIT